MGRPPDLDERERLERLRALRGLERHGVEAPPARAPAPAAPAPPEELSQTVFAVLSGAIRTGRWEPPAELRAIAIMGGVQLDFREADLLEGETVVDCLAILGGVDITVPPDVNVRTEGFGLCGGFTHVDHTAASPDAPTLVIKGIACMGGVAIRIKKPKRRWLGSGG